MSIKKPSILKTAVCVIASVALVVGLLPVIPFGSTTRSAYAEGLWQRTEAVDLSAPHVEGEALAYVVDDASSANDSGLMALSIGDDLLAASEDIMSIDATAKASTDTNSGELMAMSVANEEAAGTPVQLSGLMVGSRQATTNDLPAGSIKLVRSSSMSTAELIAALEQDPRVLFAEPNYIVDASASDAKYSSADKKVDSNTEDSNKSEEPTSETAGDDSAKEPVDEAKDASNPDEGKSASETVEAPAPASSLQAQEAPQASNWGPDGYSSASDIPSMTDWQWGNYNNGSLAGTYTHEGAIDVNYSNWNTQSAEPLREVVVGVVDCGVDETNLDLANVLWTGESFGPGGDIHGYYPYATDDVNSTKGLDDIHGTHVAGIIAAEWNGFGTSGVAPNVKIMSLRHASTLSSIYFCLNYALTAAKNGVNIVATNNSWGLGSCTSNLINVVVTELGKNGVASVFASSNDSKNTDTSVHTCSTVANNPYAITADAIDPNGALAEYSNYGIGTTDICAAGSMVLSTISNEAKGKSTLQFLGETSAHAAPGSEARKYLVSYTSFDDASADTNPLVGFTALETPEGPMGGNIKTAVKPKAGTFDGDAALSVDTASSGQVGIVSAAEDLSGVDLKPHYVSFRCSAAPTDGSSQSCRPVQVGVPVKKTKDGATENTWWWTNALEGKFGGKNGGYIGCYVDISAAENLTSEETAAGIESRVVDWDNFQLALQFMVVDPSSNQPCASTVLVDSIALGSGRYPYCYDQGTSMAAPEVCGVLAVIAGRNPGVLRASSSENNAEKLVALTKAAGVYDAAYENVCATSAYATVDGVSDPGPAIVAVEDGADSFTVTGYFMDGTAVELNGNPCEATATPLGDDKYELVVAKPAGYEGGSATITVKNNSNGKKDRSVVPIASSSETMPENVFDDIVIPVDCKGTDILAEISSWPNYQIVEYGGKIYFMPRSTINSASESYATSLFTYDPKTGGWETLRIPIEKFKEEDDTLIDNVIDVTGCVKDGELMLLITGAYHSTAAKVGVHASLGTDGEWNYLGYAPYTINGTLASDGNDLYYVGGMNGVQLSNEVLRLELQDNHILAPVEQVATLSDAPQFPCVTYSNGRLLVSGGMAYNTEPINGAEIVNLESGVTTPIDLSGVVDPGKGLAYSGGALDDGSFLLVGPIGNDGGNTFKVSPDGTVTPYGKLVYPGNIYSPSSLVYDGKFYVLATVAPTGEDSKTRIFRYISLNSPQPQPEPEPEPEPGPQIDPYDNVKYGDSGRSLLNTGDDASTLAALLAATCFASLLLGVFAMRRVRR